MKSYRAHSQTYYVTVAIAQVVARLVMWAIGLAIVIAIQLLLSGHHWN